MENTSTNRWFCHSVLEPGLYTFRACPRADVRLVPEPAPGFDRCGTVRVRIVARGTIECLEGCKASTPNACDQ